jgi:hypothetical protein
MMASDKKEWKLTKHFDCVDIDLQRKSPINVI